MPTKVKGTTGVDKVEAGAVITNPEFSGNATVTGTLTVNSTASINGSNISTQPSFRNLIINGDMQIAQRGTSVAGITGFTYNTVDRWAAQPNSMGTWTNTQDSDVPTGQGFVNSFKLECTTADASPAGTDYVRIFQRIEAQNLQHLKYGTSNAEKVTLSFWVKSNKIGTYTVRIYTEDNGRHIVNTYTISSADTWEKKTITFNADTVGTINNDNGVGFQIGWWLASGASYTSGTTPTDWEASTAANIAAGLTVNLADSTSNYIKITGVQLEVGSGSSDFEFLPYDVQLARCQRYYQVISVTLSAFNTNGLVGFTFLTEMRAAPTVTRAYVGTTNRMYNVATGGTVDVTSPTIIANTQAIRYWYSFSPSGWASSTGSGWETTYSMSSEL